MFVWLKRKSLVLCFVVFFAALAVPACAEEASVPKQEAEVLGLLKKAAGYVGSSDACHNDPDASSALNIFEAILASSIKNNILPKDMAPSIREMGRKTSNDTLSLFAKTPPMSCAEVHSSFLGFSTSIIGEYSSGPETAGAPTTEGTTAPPDIASLKVKAEQGDAAAQYELSLVYVNGEGVPQNFDEAIKWLRMASDQGYVYAQAMLALAYMAGTGVPHDDVEAAKLMLRTAEQGNVGGQGEIGILYLRGQGVPQDYVEALKWLRKAADQGYARAQSALGHMYANGKGVPEDFKEAYFWFNLAATSGSDEDANKRDAVAKMLSRQDLLVLQKRAREWKPMGVPSTQVEH